MKKFNLRLPEKLHSALATEAQDMGVSLNALIVFQLQVASDPLPLATPERSIDSRTGAHASPSLAAFRTATQANAS